jgi:hypothetical protein
LFSEYASYNFGGLTNQMANDSMLAGTACWTDVLITRLPTIKD